MLPSDLNSSVSVNPYLDAALAANAAGISVLPPKQDGTKAPDSGSWSEYIHPDPATGEIKRESAETLPRFYQNGRTGVGGFTGKASANLEVLEFDDRNTYEEFLKAAEATGLGDIVARVRAGYEEQSPNGIHWPYRCEEITGNTKLAQRPAPTADNPRGVKVLIETRGEGGYIITAPSSGSVHPTGRPYRLLSGGFDTIADIQPEERESLLALARSFDEMPERTTSQKVRAWSRDPNGARPGDDFNEHATWDMVLTPHGWTRVLDRDGKIYWRRPGKDRGISATTNATGRNTLIDFSTSTPFDTAPTSYDLFGAYAVLNHGGDFSAAARTLGEQGYGDKSSRGTRQDGLHQTDKENASQPEKEWPPLGSLPEAPAVPTLPAEMVPEPFRAWQEDIAARACVPLEAVAVPAIVGAGSVIGRKLALRPWSFSDYVVVPNTWGGIVARPGYMKTFVIGEAVKPVVRLALKAKEEFAQARPLAEAKQERLDAEISALKSQMTATAKKGGDLTDLERQLATKRLELAQASLTERRYMTQDATVEKLGELLRENPVGLLLLRDELAGWLRTLDKSGHEGDREFFLESWNGTSGYTFDRIGRGTVHIDAVTVSILGGIQPGKLRRYIQGALDGGAGDDGLLQRLQILVWPDGLADWQAPTSWPSSAAKNRVFEIFKWLDTFEPDWVQAEQETGELPFLVFSHEAQTVADSWRSELEHRLRSDELGETPAFEAHISKYRSLMPSLALVFHLIDVANGGRAGPVSLAATELAIDWCDFLELHARKIYAAELHPGIDAARLLGRKIEAGSVRDGQTVRDIYRAQWAGLGTAERVEAAIAVLAQSGWVRTETIETDGRPSEIIRLNPQLGVRSDA